MATMVPLTCLRLLNVVSALATTASFILHLMPASASQLPFTLGKVRNAIHLVWQEG